MDKQFSGPEQGAQIIGTETMYNFLFEQSPVSLWEEDFSNIQKLLHDLSHSAQEDLPAYFNDAPEELTRFIRALRIINVNSATLQLFQAPDKETLIAQLPVVFTPQSVTTFIAELEVLLRGEREYSCETQLRTLQGESRLVSLKFQINETNTGEPILDRVLLTMTDISSVLIAQQEMKDERDRVSRYLNLSNVLFVSLDKAGKAKMVNNKTCSILELPREKILGRNWIKDFIAEDSQAVETESFHLLVAGIHKSSTVHESHVRTGSGHKAIVEWHNAILRNIKGEIDEVLAFGVDMTRSRLLEEQHHRLKRQLLQTEKMKALSILARGVAHEINNPMTAIMNYASIIADEDDDGEFREYARDIQEEGKRISRIVSNFLNFAREDNVHFETVRVHSLLDDVRLLINQTMMKDGILLILLPIDTKLMIRCKLRDIQHVLFNLLMNSWEAIRMKSFSHGEKGEITVKARALSMDGADRIRIEVRDNGAGISEELMKSTFLPFLKGLASDVSVGLGLEVARDIIQEHGGHLDLQSVEGHGTVASIDLDACEEKVFI